MAETQKGTSSVKQKEKNSFLDDDIGNDFLTSWKSMSATKDDGMDFGFDTVSSGKNKAFNFEQLDMDFNLDGNFDKLSSFKVDMSDFDFSSPSKKGSKAKEKSVDESSTRKPQEKKSQFNFFDFNEMDNFDFESTLVKVGKSSTKNKDDKIDISSDKAEQGSSKIQHSDDAGIFNDTVATKIPESKGVVTPVVETLLSGPGHLSISSGAPILSCSAGSSPEKVRTESAEAIDQHSHLSEKASAMDVYSRHDRFGCPGPSLVRVDSKRNASSDRQTENSHQGTEVDTTPSEKEHVNAKVTGISSYNETSQLKNPSQMNTKPGCNNGRKNESGTDTPDETVNADESAVGDLDSTENSISSLSRKSSNDAKDKKGNQNFTTELHSAVLCSESAVDKVTLTNQNESGVLNLECPKEKASEHILLCQAASLEKKFNPSDGESMGTTYKSLETETENVVNSDEAQAGVKSDGHLVSVARESLEGDVLVMGANNVKLLNNLRECFTSDVLPNDCKLSGTSRLCGEEVTKMKPFISTSDKNVGNQNPTGFQVLSSSLSEKQKLKPSGLTSVNPKVLLSSVESTMNAKIKSVEGNKVSLVRSPKKITNLSILTTSKTKGTSGKVSDSISQRHSSTLQNPRHEMKVQYISASETAHPSEKKSPLNFSLKRKSHELPDPDLACLKHLKRFSSPQEKRNFQELPRQVVEDKPSKVENNIKPLNCLSKTSNIRDFEEPLTDVDVKESPRKVDGEKDFIHETQIDNHAKNNRHNIPVSVIESPRDVNVMDLELSLTIENDGNVEKAEAYAKDLEDICNMLRKKHEEAKEILVRALVNNNNLLMLNHPIYEEKICKVQKFAAELMSKELKT